MLFMKSRDWQTLMIDVIRNGKKTNFVISTTSMYPFFKVGERVTTKPANKIRVGDIVIVTRKVPFAHRIIKIKDDEILTKGDNNLNFDHWQNIENVIAKVVKIDKKNVDNARWRVINKMIALFSYCQGLLIERLKLNDLFENRAILRKLFKFCSNPLLYFISLTRWLRNT
jgi:signal peptidase I